MNKGRPESQQRFGGGGPEAAGFGENNKIDFWFHFSRFTFIEWLKEFKVSSSCQTGIIWKMKQKDGKAGQESK